MSRSTLHRAYRRPARTGISALLVCALTSSCLLWALPAFAASPPTFTFYGRGWGHGIGMSQWGAKGYADRGKSWGWIVTHYFPGSYLGTVAERDMLVNLDRDKAYRSTWTLIPAPSKRLKIGAKWGDPGESFTFTASGSAIYAQGSAGHQWAYTTSPGSPYIIATDAYPRTIKVAEPTGYYDVSNRAYRGDLQLTASSGKMKLVNALGMEGYIKGVLPGEISSTWDADAIKAQAVAARSYAYVKTGELSCTTADQVYVGYDYETSAFQDAVDDTRNKVVKHAASPRSDRVVQTFFHSSSGGHTANIEDVWPGTGMPSTSYPFYAGVTDPYCEEAGSPNDPWASPPAFSGLQVAAKIAPYMTGEPSGAGSSVWVERLVFDRAASAFVKTADIQWSNGSWSYDVPADAFRRGLGLKNTKFFLADFPRTRIAYGDRYATSVEVSKSLFSAGSVSVAVIACGDDGRFADALTAAGLAGVVGGPVLLVQEDRVTNAVLGELSRLGATKAYIVGGPAAVSTGVEQAVRGVVGTVQRLEGGSRYGHDRYGTAASVAMEMRSLGAVSTTAFLASGEVWPDAALAAYVSAGTGAPVLLTTRDNLPVGTRRALSDMGATTSVVYGGPVRISDGVIDDLLDITGEGAPAKRFGTSGDRYSAATQVASWVEGTHGYDFDEIYFSTGEAFPDAITGGVLAGAGKNPLLLVGCESLPGSTRQMLSSRRDDVSHITIVGGQAAITIDVELAICEALN